MRRAFNELQDRLHTFLDSLEIFSIGDDSRNSTLIYRGYTERKSQEYIESILDEVILKHIRLNPKDNIEYSVYPHRIITHTIDRKQESTEITGPSTYEIIMFWRLQNKDAVRDLLDNLNPSSKKKD